MIKTSVYEYPYGDKWFCLVWNASKSSEYILRTDEANAFYPDMDIRKAIKKIAIERFIEEIED